MLKAMCDCAVQIADLVCPNRHSIFSCDRVNVGFGKYSDPFGFCTLYCVKISFKMDEMYYIWPSIYTQLIIRVFVFLFLIVLLI